MQTYPITEKNNGLAFAFEIENIYINVSTVARILSSVDGVTEIRVRKLFSQWDEIHIWFRYMNYEYVVWEPYGDNSRYRICPEDIAKSASNIGNIENAFKNYRPAFYRKIIGDILTFQLLKTRNRNEK
jgi:hypothetical protein